jgi:hypothetical protein
MVVAGVANSKVRHGMEIMMRNQAAAGAAVVVVVEEEEVDLHNISYTQEK